MNSKTHSGPGNQADPKAPIDKSPNFNDNSWADKPPQPVPGAKASGGTTGEKKERR